MAGQLGSTSAAEQRHCSDSSISRLSPGQRGQWPRRCAPEGPRFPELFCMASSHINFHADYAERGKTGLAPVTGEGPAGALRARSST